MLTIIGLALNIAIPALTPSAKSSESFFGTSLLGIPFGLSTCPACTPLLLPVVGAAAFTADPLMGAILMFTFGLARGSDCGCRCSRWNAHSAIGLLYALD